MLDGETRTKTVGRPLGKGNLSEETKFSIVTDKKLQIYSQSKIAQDYGLSRKTINQMSEDDLSPEMQAIIHSKPFAEKLRKARDKAIDRINEKLEADTFKDGVYPNLLNAINTNYRLETNQSTSNVAEIRTSFAAHLREQGHDEAEAARLAAKAYGESDDK